MDFEEQLLLKRAAWLVKHGYMFGDVYKIADELKRRDEIQKRKLIDK